VPMTIRQTMLERVRQCDPLLNREDRHNWTEDTARKHGASHCRCCLCGSFFLGHKRRVVCKACFRETIQLG
jgi:hypothetical protein